MKSTSVSKSNLRSAKQMRHGQVVVPVEMLDFEPGAQRQTWEGAGGQ